MDDIQGNVNAKDIDISRGQAQFLKNITSSISVGIELSVISLRKALRNKPEIIHFINENWGNEEYFINLALDQKNFNPISLIFYFLNIKKRINEVPTKEKMSEISNTYVNECEYYFESWEQFLDLLGLDPWYKNNSKPKEISKIKIFEKNKKIDITQTNYFDENESIVEKTEKINLIRLQIRNICEQKDAEEGCLDYSYKEMFQLLEDYLNMLPNDRKYRNISYFL